LISIVKATNTLYEVDNHEPKHLGDFQTYRSSRYGRCFVAEATSLNNCLIVQGDN
jgi:hypothetical protein